MPSDRKIQSARANGAKSRGPITPEGRAKSSRNAVTHGLTANAIVMYTESEPKFNQIRESYLARFEPQDQVELDLVDQMVAARWRLERIWTIESAVIEIKMRTQEPQVERDFAIIDQETRTAVAFEGLAEDSKVLQLVSRYESRYQRNYSNALKTLLLLRASSPLPNEPNPKNEHPPEPGPVPVQPTPSPAPAPRPVQPNQAAGSPSPIRRDEDPIGELVPGRIAGYHRVLPTHA